MTDEGSEKKRRARYRGSHPRRFEQKYKELNPQLYSDELKKVEARGQTPAGAHRPVLVKEVLEALAPKPGMTGLDATLGYGGHSRELLAHIAPGGRLFGVDVDPIELPKAEARLRALGFGEDIFLARRMNFAGLPRLLPEAGGGFDFALADLGVSSMQLDNPARGFSFKTEAPLDLRLNPNKGLSAAEFLKTVSEDELAEILTSNADEPRAGELAKAIFRSREKIVTTKYLADTVSLALANLPKDIRKEETRKAQQRVFQALRIAVNDEFGALDLFLKFLPSSLKEGGRAAIITFHSGEDRRVKAAFKDGYCAGVYGQIALEPALASPEERRSNPRSKCAKLRWAEKAKK